MFEPRPLTTIVDRQRLVDHLDTLGVVASELETLHGDPDLIQALRAVISGMAA